MFDGSVSIAYAIQLAVAPVFLLTGITAMLGVLSNRLARIVDRARLLGTEPGPSGDGERSVLARRAGLVRRAITLCTGSGVLVALVVAVIFLGFSLALRTAPVVAVLFILAMGVFILGLLLFVREVRLATESLRFVPNVDERADSMIEDTAHPRSIDPVNRGAASS